ncbi:MAG: 2-dehydropantoate 2-reductase [Nevskia sp.]|nr:2-dehydropantoate 2-reductase [Nevskia sp.]
MRTLVLGAGGTGGYFGGRLLEANRDVSFLVRSRRAAELAETGLVIRSPVGNAKLKPRVIAPGEFLETFDLVILACKAYDLDSAIEAIAPTVGRKTVILPLLNGLKHYDALDARFGADRVLGGLCSIAVTLGDKGTIQHLGPMHVLRFGERSGERSERIEKLEELVKGANIDAKSSRDVMQALWEKWVMLASLAGMTCLMRAAIGDIVAAAPIGKKLMLQLLDECAAVANAYGRAPRPAVLEDTRTLLTKAGSTFTASMLRDIEGGHRVEADHILGDLIARGQRAGVFTSLLEIAYCHVKAYEARQARQG